LHPHWIFCGAESLGIFGELLIDWNPRKYDFSSLLTSARIMLEGLVKDLDRRMKVINCYGLYFDREVFWESIKRDDILKEHNMVLGGDLNFTTSYREVWGVHFREDSLQPYFSQLIQEEGLVDVEPIKLIPTWRNGRGGEDYIAKRLDRYLISEDLAHSGLRYRYLVCNLKIYDHMSVTLQL
jgi:hypothetical protein